MGVESAWDNFVEASRYMFRSPSPKEILLFLTVLGITVVVISVPYVLSRISRRKEIERAFFSRGKALGLTEEEIRLLWKFVRSLPYDPQMVYENKPLFEKIVSRIIQSNVRDIRLIPSIRAKLKFDTVPWFIPLTTTRDIDLYQTGKLTVDGTSVDAAVWDKTETELHIVVLQALPRTVNIGEKVRFNFIRENEGRYSFESIVKDKYTEGDRLVLVLEHTDKLNRIQLRESLRWKVNLPVEFSLLKDLEEGAVKEAELLTGRIDDISAKGVRICTASAIKPSVGWYVLMNFSIGEHKFENVLGQIMNVRELQSRVCMGIKFLKLSRQEERIIDRFILQEQRKLIKTFKIGETE